MRLQKHLWPQHKCCSFCEQQSESLQIFFTITLWYFKVACSLFPSRPKNTCRELSKYHTNSLQPIQPYWQMSAGGRQSDYCCYINWGGADHSGDDTLSWQQITDWESRKNPVRWLEGEHGAKWARRKLQGEQERQMTLHVQPSPQVIMWSVCSWLIFTFLFKTWEKFMTCEHNTHTSATDAAVTCHSQQRLIPPQRDLCAARKSDARQSIELH